MTARIKFVLLIMSPPIIYGFFDVQSDPVVVTLKRFYRLKEDNTNTPNAHGVMRRLFQPISVSEDNHKSMATILDIQPDAFRMCFYVYTVAFFAVASFVTLMWSGIDLNDNLMVDRFGYNTFSVLFNDPPFSLFASTLWFPAALLLLSFELFDWVAVYDHCLEDDSQCPVGKRFFVYYSLSTLIECLGIICFGQIFATSPLEHIYVHSWTYIFFVVSFWLMVLKQFLYFRRIQVVPRYGVIYIILCSVSISITISLYLPNLYGAKLWESSPWTTTLQQINDVLYCVLMVVAPMAIHGLIGKDINFVNMALSRSNKKETETPVKEQAISVSLSEFTP